MNAYPKISIVTPSFNDAPFLEQTILSIINQGYPNLEYIVIDGGSNDGSIDIIKKYQHALTYWVSEMDNGMYHAIQKGFERSTGEIMGWVNSDDAHHFRSLFTVAEIFSLSEKINWIQGFPNVIDETGRIVHCVARPFLDKLFFYRHQYIRSKGYVQQESTFWRRSLWERAGAHISQKYKYAGDFELWIRFFQIEKLYNTSAPLGGFRLSREGQASREHYEEYVQETIQILKEYPLSSMDKVQMRRLNFFFALQRSINKLMSLLRSRLAKASPSVMNQKIYFDGKEQKFKLR